MIIEFCVSNFLSIKEELTISFVATPLKESLSEENDILPLGNTGISSLGVLLFSVQTHRVNQMF